MTGRKKGNWSAGELARLRVLYPKCPEDRVAVLLNRSVDSVRTRARRVFQRPLQRGPWTDREDRRLREAFGVLSWKCLSLVLARSERDIKQRAAVLRTERRRGPWTSAEITRLKRLYGTRTDTDLEVCLSRSRTQIEQHARELCLRKDKKFVADRAGGAATGRMSRWSLAEEELLAELYADHDNLHIARRLGRSVASVANKANLLGLKKGEDALSRMGRRNVSIRYGAPSA